MRFAFACYARSVDVALREDSKPISGRRFEPRTFADVYFANTDPEAAERGTARLDRFREQPPEYAASRGTDQFERHSAASSLPFYKGCVRGSVVRRNYGGNEEWRSSAISTSAEDVALIIAPEDTHATLRRYFQRPAIDIAWGLVRMVASLADLPMSDLTPFSA